MGLQDNDANPPCLGLLLFSNAVQFLLCRIEPERRKASAVKGREASPLIAVIEPI